MSNIISDFYASTVGKKVVVALTGLLLFGFVFMHMLGNLKIFGGVDPTSGLHKMDMYAEFLREIGAAMLGHSTVLWATRIILLLALVMHVGTVIQLQVRNKSSRNISYRRYKPQAASYASRSMMLGGVLLFLFIVYHILHFTTGTLHFNGFEHGAVFDNVTSAFRHWYIALVYAVAMCALSLHLYHGVWSLCQTIGLDNPDRNKLIRSIATVAAFIIAVGFVLVPAAIFFGFVGN